MRFVWPRSAVPVRYARIDSKYDPDGELLYHAHDARNTVRPPAREPSGMLQLWHHLDTSDWSFSSPPLPLPNSSPSLFPLTAHVFISHC